MDTKTLRLDKFAGLASSEGSSPSDEEYSRGIEARFLAHNPNATADRILSITRPWSDSN